MSVEGTIHDQAPFNNPLSYIMESLVVSLLSQLKHILSLADQRAHASTFECAGLCSEGKILYGRRLTGHQQARDIETLRLNL